MGEITNTGMYHGDLFQVLSDFSARINNLRLADINSVMEEAEIKIGGTAANVQFSQTSVSFKVDGIATAKAATDNFWTLSGLTALTAGQHNRILLCVNSSGTASAIEGTAASTLAGVTLASLPASLSVFGELTISASAPFSPSVSSLTATGITATYKDGLPADYIGSAVSLSV